MNLLPLLDFGLARRTGCGVAASLFALGFVMGLRHALEADHLAAMAALAARGRDAREAAREALAWAAGHTVTLLAFAGLFLATSSTVPEGFTALLELAAGAMLVVLGGDLLRRLARERIHVHVHRHEDGVVHVHVHSHAADSAPHGLGHRHAHAKPIPMRSLLVGMVHGIAGTAALVVLAAAAAPSLGLALAYLAAFTASSVLGMLALSAAVALPLGWGVRSARHVLPAFHAAVGVATLVAGAAVMRAALA